MKTQQTILRLSVVVLASLLASCAGTGGVKYRNTSRTFETVVVDAGHGGKDAGARRYGPAEKVVALDVAQRVNRKLRESRFRTVMTRDSDVFIPLDRRVDIGNSQRNSVFVSIHFNHARRRGIQGFETYYASPYARSLAERIQRKLLTIPGARNRGVRTANFRVVKYAVHPSVLVECGFLTNRAEAGRARRAAYREMLADKIAEAIVEERYGSGVYFARNISADAQTPPGAPASGALTQ